jgi:uridylate kinase
MNANEQKRIVVSVGGSLIIPDNIDIGFLTRFKTFILEKVQQGFTFAIIAGGGKTARRYQNAAGAITPLARDEIDWIGIQVTRINAQFLRSIFAGYVHPLVIKNPTAPIVASEPIIIGTGYRPGYSTDYCAVMLAKNLGATRLVNLTHTYYGDYVYDRSPLENSDAKKIEKISWTEFKKLIPADWKPGLSSLFDPVATKEAEAMHLEVALISGADLNEFSNYLDGKPFAGTVIS